ncbi:MAG: undecaprenyl/decaprenyl-phosphate alpha-N-acetylglucosaminyl 1-phosphate transferase [Deltaproteobacteria bacterium]|nr:undecaprenyl/decaprenyl-phosphate alpha-N-acetylglucosaminyl 1-phosphate transferase [Candidatus Anaeroferrophillacea bacterium]
MNYFISLLTALYVTVIMVPICRRLALKFQIVDLPDARKVHQHPIPRIGGVAMALGALVPVCLWLPPDPLVLPVLGGAGILVAAGFLDDVYDLDYRLKFGAQILAAVWVAGFGGVAVRGFGGPLSQNIIIPPWFGMPLTLVIIVGVTNAINLADGLDGLAGGISLLSFACIGLLSWGCGDLVIGMLAAAVIGALLGFLRYNTYPATIFMGDAGSQMLGFLAISLTLGLTRRHAPLSPFVPLLLLGFPILDTLSVMTARIYHGRSPFAPDKNHFHHKLMRIGLTHRQSVMAIYALQLLLTVSAWLFRFYPDWMLLGGYLVFCFLVLGFFYLCSVGRLQFGAAAVNPARSVSERERRFVDPRLMIIWSFRALRVLVPLMLLLVGVTAAEMPRWAGWGAIAGAAGILLVTRLPSAAKVEAVVLRLPVYLLLPILCFQDQAVTRQLAALWVVPAPRLLLAGYLALAAAAVLVVRYSRRAGYQTTPLDLLILSLVLFIPLVRPVGGDAARVYGLLSVQLLTTFYSFEVLVEELRGDFRRLRQALVAVLLLWALRGLLL